MNDIAKDIAKTPAPVLGMYDAPMWESIRAGGMTLQCCRECRVFQYPPAPVCHACLSSELDWTPVGGEGEILSWVVYHRQYLPAYPAPYNVISVRLKEGPVLVSNLEGSVPEGSWIGRKVRLRYAEMPDGFVLPRFALDAPGAP
ncbi:MAG TPA: OB-fold domain-containing protein [Bordetella sp.]